CPCCANPEEVETENGSSVHFSGRRDLHHGGSKDPPRNALHRLSPDGERRRDGAEGFDPVELGNAYETERTSPRDGLHWKGFLSLFEGMHRSPWHGSEDSCRGEQVLGFRYRRGGTAYGR